MAGFGSLTYGSGVEYYTSTAGSARGMGTNYYTGASAGGEPAGRWSGRGAEALGLSGEIDAKVMEDLYTRGVAPDGTPFAGTGRASAKTFDSVDQVVAEKLAKEPDALPERVREIEREARRQVRTSNTFADFTFSLSKDITVQHTAAAYAEERARRTGNASTEAHWRTVRETIEEAGYAGSAAAVQYLTDRASFVRTGRHGSGSTGRWVEAPDLVVATFFQHTSRAGDPQLHFHNPILLNTRCADGKIRKLHTSVLRDHRAAAAAHGARVTQEVISERLGWTFSPRTDGNGHELDNVSQEAKDLFSERARNITESVKPLVEDYVATYGVEPNNLALDRLKQQATLKTRPQKEHGESREDAIRRWDQKLRAEVGEGLGRQAARSTTGAPPVPETFSPRAVLARAIARVQESKATFTRSDLTRAVEAELPGYLGVGAEGALKTIETLVDRGLEMCVQVTANRDYKLPDDFKLSNGASSYVQPGSVKFASEGHIAAEEAIERAAVTRGRERVDPAAADRWLKEHAGMGASLDQQAAIKGIMTSGAALTALEGPAGTGKTFTLGGLSQAWNDTTGGRVLGLATSEQATEVLRGEGVQAKNIAQWLAAQRRLDEGRPIPQDQEWAVQKNDIIVPDEASMADTDKLGEIRRYVERAGARMVLAGDPRQLAAVGSGGAMDLVVNTKEADKYKLTEVRRFNNTWEGQASLDLREGDKGCIDQYAMHDRIRAGGTVEETLEKAAELYAADRLAGKSSVVVTVTNADAATVNGKVRDRLVEAGRVDEAGVYLERDGNTAGVGDIIKARQTDWTPGAEMRNQGRYVVKAVHDDGGLTVTEMGTGVEKHIAPEYRSEFVELGYAGTAHSTQGATVDTAINVVKEGQSLESLYVGASRGRERNTMVVVTEKEHVDPRSGEAVRDEPIDAAGVVANVIEADQEDGKAALTQMREDVAREESVRTVSDMYEEAMREFGRQRTSTWLDRMAADGKISEHDRERLAADQSTEQLGRLLRVVEQAGHDPKEVLEKAAEGSLATAGSPAQVLHHRITQQCKDSLALDAERSVLPPADAPADYQEHFEELTDMIRERRQELGAQQAAEPSAWATETLGPVPEDLLERAEWEDRAGTIAAYREQSGFDHDTEAVGHTPGFGKTEARAAWAKAWEAAGRPDTTAEEHSLTEGALRNRVEAMRREDAALPDSVYAQMESVERELYDAQQKAAAVHAEADLVEDEWEAAVLREKAAEHESYAERWEAKRARLQAQDDARRELVERTATTRELGTRAREELENVRGVQVDQEDDRCTAAEWLEREAEARVEDDPHRQVAETDLAENTDMTNERVEADVDVVIGEAESDLPGAVPTGEDVAARDVKTERALEEDADRLSQEAAYREPDDVVQDYHEQVTAEPEVDSYDEVLA